MNNKSVLIQSILGFRTNVLFLCFSTEYEIGFGIELIQKFIPDDSVRDLKEFFSHDLRDCQAITIIFANNIKEKWIDVGKIPIGENKCYTRIFILKPNNVILSRFTCTFLRVPNDSCVKEFQEKLQIDNSIVFDMGPYFSKNVVDNLARMKEEYIGGYSIAIGKGIHKYGIGDIDNETEAAVDAKRKYKEEMGIYAEDFDQFLNVQIFLDLLQTEYSKYEPFRLKISAEIDNIIETCYFNDKNLIEWIVDCIVVNQSQTLYESIVETWLTNDIPQKLKLFVPSWDDWLSKKLGFNIHKSIGNDREVKTILKVDFPKYIVKELINLKFDK